jgi:YidC/Oxa1 family membrane protein insertase
MPIWLALYRMLSTAGELYNAPFIPGWIDALTAKDPYYILGVALVILMFVQAKLQPATGDGMQQKIMMYVLPGVFGVMSLFFPSGLTLYILTNTILTALHSIYMRKFDKSAKLHPATAVANLPISGRGAGVVVAGPEKKSKVIDVKAEEVDEDEGDDVDDEAPAPKSPAPNKNVNRQRRGKRRGGRN